MNDLNNQDVFPTASLSALKSRAMLLQQIRRFFDERGFFEVETPLLSSDTVVDRHLHPIQVERQQITGKQADAQSVMFLQTSPEFAMKRMLAAGADSIYQICKAFRAGETGRQHNPEFTMLEWYRVGDDMLQGLLLLEELIQSILNTKPATRISYRTAFRNATGLDPFTASIDQLANRSKLKSELDRDEHLNLILSRDVEPGLGIAAPESLYHYPASQAALAKTKLEADVEVAERFRNDKINEQRAFDGSLALPTNSRLLAAMKAGMPACSGVALGVDRLLILALQEASTQQEKIGSQENHIESVIAFPFDRA